MWCQNSATDGAELHTMKRFHGYGGLGSTFILSVAYVGCRIVIRLSGKPIIYTLSVVKSGKMAFLSECIHHIDISVDT